MISWWRDFFHFSFRLANKFNVFYLFIYFSQRNQYFFFGNFFVPFSSHHRSQLHQTHLFSVSVSISFENYGICISIAILHSIHHIFASILQFFRTYRFLLFWCMPGESAWTWKEPMNSATFITVSSFFFLIKIKLKHFKLNR